MWLFNLCCRDAANKEKKLEVIPKAEKVVVSKKRSYHEKEEKMGSQQQCDMLDQGKFSKRDRYEGEELSGQAHGNGSMLYANGDFYRGEWVNGKKEGRGLQIYQELGVQYQGQWQNDQPSGNGKLLQPNGSFYIGDFKGGIKHGRGLFYDFQKKQQYNQYYSNGTLKEHVSILLSKSKEQEFPTLALDKERFNTGDLNQFENRHPEIRKFDLFALMKYYGMCKLSKLEFISKNMKEWTIKEVIDFLDIIELKLYKEKFYKNKIKGKDLITLSQKQLKDDLTMKMGDRKRFLNYVEFLKDISKEGQPKLKSASKQKSSYRLRSASSMKKVLKTVKHYAVFEQSIQEQNSQSSNQSQKFRSTQKIKIDGIYPSVNEREYDSVAVDRHSGTKSVRDKSSFQQIMQAKSERSSKQRDREIPKDGKDLDQMNQGSYHKDHLNKSSLMIGKFQNKQGEHIINHRHSQDDKEQHKDHNKQSNKSSSTSSEESAVDLHRKKTHDKNHQSTQIRQLYEFLKSQRSLQFLIKQKDIEKMEQIGQGGYGKVYKGKYVGMQIAIKDYLKTGKDHHQEDFMKQVQIISDLKHPNIVLYMGMCITANKYTLITQYLENGSLFDQLHKKKKKFTAMEEIEIAFDIVKGMVYLHYMKKILHRDLKSSNVLIGEDWQVKLCDFGLSAQKKKNKKKKSRIGTYQWMAPQVIRNEEKIDQFADVYSFGVIIWEMLSQKIPYEGLSEQQIIGLVGYDNQHHLEEPPNSPPFLISVMRECLKRQANERPTFIQVQSQFEEYLAANKQKSLL